MVRLVDKSKAARSSVIYDYQLFTVPLASEER